MRPSDNDINRAAFRTRAVDNFVYIVVSTERRVVIISPQGKILVEGMVRRHCHADIDPFGGREEDAFNHQRHACAVFRSHRLWHLDRSNPPMLKRCPRPSIRKSASLKALTVGEDDFRQAAGLASAGQTKHAIEAFEKLRVEYRGTWIDRVAQDRLKALRRPDAETKSKNSPEPLQKKR